MRAAIFLLFVLSSSGVSYAAPGDSFDANARLQYFDRETEFPNFFLPKQYRELPSKQIPAEVIRQQQTKLEAALHSVFERLLVPVVPEGSTFAKNVRYFPYLRENVGEGVHVMPSGGVVRSALGYLYYEMYKGAIANPPISPDEVLERITKGTEGIPGFKIRGIGSDFDLLIKGDADKIGAAKETILKITNSAETHYDARQMKGDFKRSLFTVGDVKDYDEQIKRSTSQGGATIDFLAFDNETGKFVQPENHAYIVEDFLRGAYRYIAPEGTNKEDSDKQTIRGIRGLLELPFLKIHDEEQLKQEIDVLIEKLKSGKDLSAKALDQTGKIIRNARFAGAHNRIYRGRPGSLEEKVVQLNDLFIQRVGSGKYNGVPEFVDSSAVEHRDPLKKPELNGLPAHLLTPMNEFVLRHSKQGTVHHGAPTIDQAMAIMRGGLIVSGGRNNQGGYAYGRGGYSSGDPQVSLGYAGSEGVVLELPIKQLPQINILDLRTRGEDPAVKEIRAKAIQQSRDFHEVLTRDHGIDVILSGHVLIQNMEAFTVPEDPAIILKGFHLALERPDQSVASLISAYINYRKLYPYAASVGLEVPPPPSASSIVHRIHGKSSDYLKTVMEISSHPGGNSLLREALSTEPALKENFRPKLPSLFAASGGAIWFPWDIHDPKDVQTLRQIQTQAGGANTRHLMEKGLELADRIQKAEHRSLIGVAGVQNRSGWGIPAQQFIGNTDPLSIEDLGLRQELVHLKHQWNADHGLREAMETLFHQTPYEYLRHFGDIHPDWRMEYGLTVNDPLKANPSSDPQDGWEITAPNSPHGDAYRALMVALRSGTELSPNEELLLRFFARFGRTDAITAALISASKKTRGVVLSALEAHPAGAVRYLKHDDNWASNPQTRQARKTALTRLSAAMSKSPSWRKAVRELFLSETMEPHLYGNYPWDLKNTDDVAYLRQAFSHPEQNLDRVTAIIQKLRAAGTKINDWSAQNGQSLPLIDPYSIANPALRREYVEAVHAQIIGSPGAVSYELKKRFPKLTAQLFPSIGKTEKPSRPENYSEMLTRWNSHGYGRLSPAEKKFLQVLRPQLFPPEWDGSSHLGDFLKAGPQSRSWILARIEQFSSQDTVGKVLESLAKEGVLAEVKARPMYASFKARLRDAVRQSKKIGNLTAYPWDLADTKDIELLKEMETQSGGANARQLIEKGLELAERIRQAEGRILIEPGRVDDRTGWGIPGHHGIERADAASIETPRLRQELADLKSQWEANGNLRDALLTLLSNHPYEYARRFGHIHPDWRIEFGLANQDSLTSLPSSDAKADWQVRAPATPQGEAFRSLIASLQAGIKLNPDQQSLLRFYSRFGRTDAITAGLLSKENKQLVLSELKAHPEAAVRYLVHDDTWAGNPGAREARRLGVMRLSTAMSQTPEWRKQVREHFLKDTQQAMHYANYPWDLKDAGDRSYLIQAFSDPDQKIERLTTVIRKLRSAGVEIHDWSPEDGFHSLSVVDQYSIPDPHLRKEYVEAVHGYSLAASEVVSRDLLERFPKLALALFPQWKKEKSPARVATYADMLKRWNSHGFRRLSKEERKFLSELRPHLFPAFWQGSSEVAQFLKAGPQSRLWMLSRIEQFSAQDDLAQVLKSLDIEGVAAELRVRPAYPQLKERLRASIEKQITQAQVGNLKSYPWDLSDPKDSYLLRKIENYSAGAHPRQLIEQGLELADRIQKAEGRSLIPVRRSSDRSGWGIPGHLGIQRASPLKIADPAMRQELETLQHRWALDHQLREVATKLFASSPFQYIRQFGHLNPDWKMEFGLVQDAIQAYPSVEEDWDIKAPDSPLGHAYRSLLDTLKAGEKPSAEQEALLKFFVRFGRTDVITASLIGPSIESRITVLNALKAHPAAAIRYLAHDDSKWGASAAMTARQSAVALLSEALSQTPEWRNSVREGFLSGTMEPWYYEAYPWDLTEMGDVAYLHKARSQVEQKADVLTRTLWRLKAAGVEIDEWSPADGVHRLPLIDSFSIADAHMRKEYVEAVHGYLLSREPKEGGPSLPLLEVSDPAAIRTLLESKLAAERYRGLLSLRHLENGAGWEWEVAQLLHDADATIRSQAEATLSELLVHPVSRDALARDFQKHGVFLLGGHLNQMDVVRSASKRAIVSKGTCAAYQALAPRK